MMATQTISKLTVWALQRLYGDMPPITTLATSITHSLMTAAKARLLIPLAIPHVRRTSSLTFFIEL